MFHGAAPGKVYMVGRILGRENITVHSAENILVVVRRILE
jgi:hypothetical protein